MAVALDHILWAAPDLDAGSRLFAELTGVEPARGGSHPGFGTRNSLVALGNETYLEIISPDPEQTLIGNRGGQIAALPRPGLLTFAARTDDLADVRRAADSEGLTINGPVAMSRTRPDGVKLAWSVLYLRHAALGEAVPFFIDWCDSPHPSATAPPGCTLRSFIALAPEPLALERVYGVLGVAIEVKRAPQSGFMAALGTPRGEVTLLSP